MASAALMRAAMVTVPAWKRHKQWLLELAHEHLPVAQWLKGTIWPKFWDSPAMAVNLSHAASCFPGDEVLQKGALSARAVLDKLWQSKGATKLQVQSTATKALREALYTNNIHSLFSKRLAALLPDRRVRVPED